MKANTNLSINKVRYNRTDGILTIKTKDGTLRLNDKGIPIGKIYPEDGELIMVVDEDKLKGDNDNE